MFANAHMSNGDDWIKIENYTQPSFTVVDLGANTCSYQYGFLYTIYYSYAVLQTNRHYYIRQLVQSPLTTTTQTSTVAAATASLSLHHSFKYVYVPPDGTVTSAIISNSDKYGTGVAGLITRFFAEVILPLLQPSSVDSG
jgi:hypothetical protein